MGCCGRTCEYFHIDRITPTWVKKTIDANKSDKIDGLEIAKMLVPVFYVDRGNHDKFGSWYFTCRHFDKVKRLCTIYESRPEMCRTYPNGRRCSHSIGCSERGNK